MFDGDKKKGCGCGIGSFGVGSVVAMIISFTTWHSIPWMLLHGFLGWVYVIYYLFRHKS
ncbi:MAG: hypothetical protein LBT74_01175 [Acidobacteriota bacterium]|jgi:hypothetical protein|nr:hypothetical protein [Acidobacteriota bacterium]